MERPELQLDRPAGDGDHTLQDRPIAPFAFAAIYDRYFSRVYNYLRCRVGDRALVDELTSRTFERAFGAIDRFGPERASLATWLFTIARRVVIDHRRRAGRWRFVSLAWLPERSSSAPAPDERLIARERRHLLLAALRRLPEREREIVALKLAGGRTNREIARLTGLREGHVGVILFRAIRKLREQLETMEANDD